MVAASNARCYESAQWQLLGMYPLRDIAPRSYKHFARQMGEHVKIEAQRDFDSILLRPHLATNCGISFRLIKEQAMTPIVKNKTDFY